MTTRRRSLLLLSCAWMSQASNAARPERASSQETSVRAFVVKFLRAFEDLDLPGFIDCFADDATAFFPVPEPPSRVDGQPAIRSRFETVFAAIRRSAAGGPPYHRLVPEDLAVQLIGPDSAVVSFHLRNADRIARRTLVLRRNGEQWLIVHLHASNVPVDPG